MGKLLAQGENNVKGAAWTEFDPEISTSALSNFCLCVKSECRQSHTKFILFVYASSLGLKNLRRTCFVLTKIVPIYNSLTITVL